MKIALNLANLRGYGSGLVGRNVLRSLARIQHDHQLRAWIPFEWGWTNEELSGVDLQIVRGGIPAKIAIENTSMRVALRAWPADVLFSLGDTSIPRCSVPHLLLVHQPYIAYPREQWGFATSAAFSLRVRLINAYFALGLSTASTITVQTEHMRRALHERWHIPLQRLVVVPSAIESLEHVHEASSARPYLCYVASASAHKNHVLIADVLAALSRRDVHITCRLTVDSSSVPELCARARKLGVMRQIEFLGGVSLERAHRLMSAASVVLMPSKMETFGIPLWEAMALGAPLVASDRAFAREACGAGALYADPDDGEQWAAHIAQLLSSPETAGQQRRRALERHRQAAMSWDEVARLYLELLENMHNRPGAA